MWPRGESAVVGRDEELAFLAGELDRRSPSAVLLAGEPGIGKTTVWQAASRLGNPAGSSLRAVAREPRSGMRRVGVRCSTLARSSPAISVVAAESSTRARPATPRPAQPPASVIWPHQIRPSWIFPQGQ
jgi:hypothetical protein